MTPIQDPHLIIFDQLSDERREVVHELVKAKADGWWHNMPNIWIVGGKTSEFWRDELHPVIAGTGASILVMRLPRDLAERRWAFQGPNAKTKTDWLHGDYFGTPQKE